MLNPLPPQKWSFETAAHLLNRAGFGGTPEEIEALHQAGLEAAVDGLLHPPSEPGEEEEDKSGPWMTPENLRIKRHEGQRLRANLAENRKKIRERRQERLDEILDLRLWWLERMRVSDAPLLEKMTLFWHGHFATSAVKVKDAYWMWLQNETLRRHALGNFRDPDQENFARSGNDDLSRSSPEPSGTS